MKTVHSIVTLLAITFAAARSSEVAVADIIVDVQDVSIAAGGTGFVDVLIHSSGIDTLDFASYDFAITNVGGPSSTLQFANPQDLTEDGLANYVFAGDNFGIVDQVVAPTQFIADDATDALGPITLTATTRLLARLELEHVLGGGQTAAQANGDQFRITLQNTGDTSFQDDMFNSLNVDASSFDALVGGGLITASAAAVPEPSSVALLAMGGLAFFYRRRRANAQSSAVS